MERDFDINAFRDHAGKDRHPWSVFDGVPSGHLTQRLVSGRQMTPM